jgi:dTDP-4-dehydrorhamnose 3,5-epimerase-like enzyme
MSVSEPRFVQLEDQGDARGALFRVPAELLEKLGPVGDVHFGTILPGALRGNHAHRGNSEVLLLQWKDRFQVAYDRGDGDSKTVIELEGHGAAALLLPPLCAHAIRNTGAEIVEFTSMPSSPYDITDVVRRTLL